MMHHRFLIAAATAVAFLGAGPLGPTTLRAAGDETPVGREMEGIADAFAPLRRAMKQPDAAAVAQYRQWAATMKKHAEAAKGMEPAKAAKLPAADRKKMVAEFQKSIGDLVEKIAALDQALAAGKLDQAAKITEELNRAKAAGHEKFKADG